MEREGEEHINGPNRLLDQYIDGTSAGRHNLAHGYLIPYSSDSLVGRTDHS
jgi:hypothetical protein